MGRGEKDGNIDTKGDDDKQESNELVQGDKGSWKNKQAVEKEGSDCCNTQSSSTFLGSRLRARTQSSRTSQSCSMMLILGKFGGQGRHLIW